MKDVKKRNQCKVAVDSDGIYFLDMCRLWFQCDHW